MFGIGGCSVTLKVFVKSIPCIHVIEKLFSEGCSIATSCGKLHDKKGRDTILAQKIHRPWRLQVEVAVLSSADATARHPKP